MKIESNIKRITSANDKIKIILEVEKDNLDPDELALFVPGGTAVLSVDKKASESNKETQLVKDLIIDNVEKTENEDFLHYLLSLFYAEKNK